ncbi:hypothetical protein M9458_029854, partial [Cirrhinus mrigala]
KQRHNKLDLSENHEPLCKAPRSLDRSDPHNNNGPASIQQMLGIAVLESLTNPQLGTGNTHTKLAESPSKVAHEDPILPPRPRQRAATVVPEQNIAKNSHLNLAVSEPVARRQRPPSLHVLSPEKGEGKTTSDLSSHASSCPRTRLIKMTLINKDEGNLPSPSTPEADSPSVPGLASSDDNNNPNAGIVDAGAIDFFSAREKFLCLSQDSQPRSFSETTTHSRCTPPLDDSSEEAHE